MRKIKTNKKGMEISTNTIVIAIICLIVLVVVIMVFQGAISDVAKKFQSTTDRAGKEGDKTLDSIFPKETSPGQESGDNADSKAGSSGGGG